MSFRIEAKIPLTLNDLNILRSTLLDKGMTSLYPKRFIRSIYFDNKYHDMFNESEEGVIPRKKMRIRNYPQKQETSFNLEIKISSEEGRFKTSRLLNLNEYESIIKNGYFDKDYGQIFPTIVVEYWREYFLYKNRRFTFDTAISYSNLIKNQVFFENHCVMEVKTSTHDNLDDITNIIKTPLKRFSKYCNGMLKIKNISH